MRTALPLALLLSALPLHAENWAWLNGTMRMDLDAVRTQQSLISYQVRLDHLLDPEDFTLYETTVDCSTGDTWLTAREEHHPGHPPVISKLAPEQIRRTPASSKSMAGVLNTLLCSGKPDVATIEREMEKLAP